VNRNIPYARVLLVVLCIVVLLAFVNRSPRPVRHDAWLPSSFNPVGAGTMALYETLQETNWPVERWREPLSRLPAYGTGNTLVITRSRVGSRVPFTAQETELLDDWVLKGNTLLLLGAFQESDDARMLLHQFGITVMDTHGSIADFFQPFEPRSEKKIEIKPASSIVHGNLVLPERTRSLPLRIPPGAKVLWQEEGQPYVIALPRGAGQVICAASAQMMDNQYLAQGDNLAVVLQLFALQGKTPNHLFFEESHHGYSAIYALARLFDHPGVRFAGMLTLLGALAFLGSSLVRFGPLIPLQRDAGRSTLEFIDSIADLYQRADLRNDMMAFLFTETHQRVLARLNLPPNASHEIIAARLQKAHPQLPRWKKLAQRFDSTDYTEGLPPGGWLRVARELIEIKSAMA
jgi:hypothetical protein